MLTQALRLASLVAGSLAFFALAAPDADAQRGSTGVRTQHLVAPQTNLPAVPPASTPRRAQRQYGLRPTIVLTGYWPPTNEAVRRFSTDPLQNPQGWIGMNWEGRGYDVVSFFPEFVPPNCTDCGPGNGDLEVDYQDTSNDFWQLIPTLKPVAIITFSRGLIDLSWEIEVNQYNRFFWSPDYVAPTQPTPTPPDAGWPVDALRLTMLPVERILDAVSASGLGTNPYVSYSDAGGGFLSEFMAYHGVWYQDLHSDPLQPDWCVAAGHVHVGGNLSTSTAEAAAKVTLREVTEYLDELLGTTCAPAENYCTAKTNSLGCVPTIGAVGYPSLASDVFQVRVGNVRNNVQALLTWSFAPAATPFQGGFLCNAPPRRRTTVSNTGGVGTTPNCSGLMGVILDAAFVQAAGYAPGQDVFFQGWSRDSGDPFGSSLTDGLSFTWCP